MAKDIKYLVSKMRTSQSKSYSDNRYIADPVVIDDINDIQGDLFVFESDMSNNPNYVNNNIRALFIDECNMPHEVSIRETQYKGESQVSAYSRELSLNGFYWIISTLEKANKPLDDELRLAAESMFLKTIAGVSASSEQIFELAAFRPEFKVSIFEFEDEDASVWITYDEQKLLKKITVKPKTVSKYSVLSNSKLNLVGL